MAKRKMSMLEKLLREFNEGDIEIADNIFVSEDHIYKSRAGILVQLAKAVKRGKKEKGYHDNKMLVTLSGIESLIGAGARIINLNRPSVGNKYVHEVLYEDHLFITSSAKQYIYTIENSLQV